MMCSHGRGGVEPVRTFCGEGGEGVDFSRFSVDVFYGGLLPLPTSVMHYYLKFMQIELYEAK